MKTRQSHFRGSSGSTLLMAVILTVIIASVVGVAALFTMQTARDARRTVSQEGAQAVADAYLDWAYDQWLIKCHSSNNVPLASDAWTDPLPNPPAGYLTQPTGFQIANFKIHGVDPQLNDVGMSTPPTGSQAQSTGDITYTYLASVDVSAQTTIKKSISVQARRIFQKTIQSPWQYAIFFNDDLEMHPSPKFTVNGWVHTNGSMYASPDGGNPLIFLDPRVEYSVPPPSPYQVDGYAPGDPRGTGAGHVGAPNTYAGAPTTASRQDPFGISPSQFNTSDTNTNNDSYRELIERPDTNFTDPFTSGTDQNNKPINPRYYNAADIKVLVDANNNITVLQGQGAGAALSTSDPTYVAVVAALTTNQVIEDWREGTSQERVVTLDVNQLNTAIKASKVAGWNGVIYISDTSATSTARRAVRVKNGSTVPTNGITVVTDNPLYVQGDFNTASPRQPTALVGDAINVLSNAWVDSNSTLTSPPAATSTTVNAAFLAGIVPTPATGTSTSTYSGGVENFPRFHENWSGQTFTYNGSMVELFYSKQATGMWSAAKYSPPIRNWAFDTIFRTTPPPGSLMLTTYKKQLTYNHPQFQ